MAYEQTAGQGTLSISKSYEEGGSKPKHYGDILLDQNLVDKIISNGYKMPISGWEKSGSWGTFISLSVNTFLLDKEKQSGGLSESTRQLGNQAVVGSVTDTDTPF